MGWKADLDKFSKDQSKTGSHEDGFRNLCRGILGTL